MDFSDLNLPGSISRRGLIKLMAMASPAVSLMAGLEGVAPAEDSAGARRQAARPRLFYNSASLTRIKQMLAAKSETEVALKKRGDELLAAEFYPESVAEIGGGQQANYRTPGIQIQEMGLTLGLLYHLTGDQRYGVKLRDAMLYYGHYVRWAGPGLADRFPPWHSVLETTLFNFGYAAGYDALHQFLSEADRNIIADTMVRLGVLPTLNDWILPGMRVHALDSMGHNWWGVCVSGAGLSALALLGDDPRAQGWIDAVDAGYIQWFNYPGNVLQNRVPTFERSGPSYEGVNYTNYGVSEYLHYRFAWQNTYPGRRAAHIEPLDGLATFFLHTLYPTANGFVSVNFEDSPLRADTTASVLLLIACGLGTPDAARYLERVHTHPEGTLFTLLRQHAQPTAQGEAPTSMIYPRMGWAMMRSSWENDGIMLAMKSGYTWNHAHADAGSFVLFKQGMPLIIDSGTCSYGRPEYNTYYRLSRAHNVILFNGEGQSPEDLGYGCKFPGHMHSLVDGQGLKYVYADATGPTARWFSRNYRSWLWSGNLILVIDDLRAHTAGRLDWLLHFSGEYTAASTNSVSLKNGPAEAVVKMLYPAVNHREETGLAEHDPDRKIPYLAFTPEAEARLSRFITAICLDPRAVPDFDLLQGKDYIGIRARTADTVEETYLNLRAIEGSIHMNCAVKIGDWLTDAYVLHLTRPAAPDTAVERYFLSDGSYLRRGPVSLIESLSKLTACWKPDDALDVHSDAGSASIQIGADRAPRSVHWNGNAVSASYDRGKKLVWLTRPRSGIDGRNPACD